MAKPLYNRQSIKPCAHPLSLSLSLLWGENLTSDGGNCRLLLTQNQNVKIIESTNYSIEGLCALLFSFF